MVSERPMRGYALFRTLRHGRPRFSSWSRLLPCLLVLLLAMMLSLWSNAPEETKRTPPPPKPPPPAVVLPEPSPPEPAPEEETGCPEGCLEPRPGCAIKGNFRKERIYHLPGQRYYDRTVIDPGEGERWFCTEEEAVANGWRKAKV
jgi:hypothetical protein